MMPPARFRPVTVKLALAGGVEHMGHIPMTQGIDINPAAAQQ